MRRRTIVTTTALFLCTTSALTACSSGTGAGSGSGSGSAKDSAAAKAPASATPAPATPAAEKAPFANLTGGQIATNAMKATRQASSLHMKVSIADPKEGTTKMDMSLNSKGECTGTMGQGKDTVRLIEIGKAAYVNPRSSGGKWSKVDTTTPDGKGLASACDLNGFLGGFEGDDNMAKKGPTTTVGGVPAIVLTETDGAEHYTLDVATTGKPYLLKMVTVGGDSPGTLEFSHFNEPVHAAAPPKSQIAAR